MNIQMVPVVCMGYVQDDGSNYICPADLGFKEFPIADDSTAVVGATHGCCPDCMTITLANMRKNS